MPQVPGPVVTMQLSKTQLTVSPRTNTAEVRGYVVR
jgi:hypothetical protein